MFNTPLSVSGQYIIDAAGQRVKLVGANWTAHNDLMVPDGLDTVHREALADTIVGLGLNSIRLTYALRMFDVTTPVSKNSIRANPDLFGLTPWQVYQVCVQALTSRGIAVIPNCHLLYPGWCCGTDDSNGLWWNSNWPESKFYRGLQILANAFKTTPLVVGVDIKNEPRTSTIAGTTYNPSWGDGNTKTDFALMYNKAAKTVHDISPDKLIICEGLNYASNLKNAKAHPVAPATKTVYSMHDYSWFHPQGQSYSAYKIQMDANGGYLIRDSIAPVWFGEFGVNDINPLGLDNTWIGHFFQYAKERELSACWWLLDATMHSSHVPVTNELVVTEGARQGFGLLNADWTTPTNPDVIAQLNALV